MERNITKGSVIGVFSPSWCITHDAPEAAVRAEEFIISNGFKVKRGRLWGQGYHYRSGSAKERAAEFNELLYDDEVDCLMASVGGFVTNGMLEYIDYDYFSKNPKPIIGMSDVTSLLMAIYAKTNIPVYYGTNFVTSYARLSPYRDIALRCFLDVVNFDKSYEYTMPKYYSDELIEWERELSEEKQIPNEIITVNSGKVTGRLIGGNLYTLSAVCGTPYMPEIKEGDILFLEDTEASADFVERYVSWLRSCGVFDRISGLIIGKCRQFCDCGTGKKYYEILTEVMGKSDFPILAECDFSHCAPMLTIPIGVNAELDADAKTLKLLG